MAQNNIIFRNLRAELARRNLCLKDVAKAVGCNRDTVGRKLSGKSPLNLDEAMMIQERLFPDQDIKYLFLLDDEPRRAG